MSFRQHPACACKLAPAALALLTTGCSAVRTIPATQATPLHVHLNGSAMGGQQPIVGGKIYLVSLGEAGLASPSNSMLIPGQPGVSTDANGRGYVLTDDHGSFSLTGDYAPCTDPADPVYLVATGGNPGLSPGTDNQAIALASYVGACGTLSPSQYISLNELTTVAFVSAFSPFTSDLWHIGYAPGNPASVIDAAAAANRLVNPATGKVNSTAGAQILPAENVRALANSLAACVNSSSASSPICTALMDTAYFPGNPYPSDTFAAMVTIAQNPAHNVDAIFNLPAATAPFHPTPTQAPADWTLASTIDSNLPSAPGVIELGDSITHGYGASDVSLSYGQLLASYLGGPLNNGVALTNNMYSQNGDEAIDIAYKAWMVGIPKESGNSPVTLMIGTNDIGQSDNDASNTGHQQLFHDTLMADLSLWLTPPSHKLIPYGNPACSGPGWTADNSFSGSLNGTGVASSLLGTTFSCTFSTTGAPIFLWHLIDGSDGTADVTIDALPCGSFANTYPNWVTSNNGRSTAVAALRCPVAAGSHVVSVTMTGGSHVGFEGLGTPIQNPSAVTAPPRMYVFGPIHKLGDFQAWSTFVYSKMVENLAAQMADDGFLVQYVDVRNHVPFNGNPDPNNTQAAGDSCMYDSVHPNNCGHAAMANVLKATIPLAP